MIKQGGAELIKVLMTVCNRVWTKEKLPEDWKEGIIIPIPKKRDLRECTNWSKGITLLFTPGPGKMMRVILLNRIRNAVDGKPGQEQAGFIPGRS